MVNVRQLLWQILQHLGLIADYVVEQGTSGIWTYRKWQSGVAECWVHTSLSTAITTKVGSMYVQSQFTTVNFPTGLFITAPLVFTNTTTQGAQWAQANSITSASFKPRIFYPVVYSNAIAWDFDFYVKGKWK